MPGPHYAISESLIVCAALWSLIKLGRQGLWLAALGSAIFGAAAAIGVYRFAANEIDALAVFHKDFSQTGGAVAMALISAQLLLNARAVSRSAAMRRVIFAAIFLTGGAAAMVPASTTPLFLAWLVGAILTTLFLGKQTAGRRMMAGAITSIFLINLLLIRQSPLLPPAVSWHLFHILVAVWLLAMLPVFTQFENERNL
ncbi:hypothetical protein [Parasphingorhabdus sp.]|uniref:hypothetical protein n=1 Tax=Parasphingorhabdus sp. TaxID=2709688 RepID=UPI003001A59E